MYFDVPTLVRLIILLWVFVWFAERCAEFLQYHEASKPYPESLSEIQPPNEHEKALAYLGERTRLGWLRSTVDLVAFLAFFLLNGFGMVSEICERIGGGAWLRATLFIGGLSLLKGILDLPFDYYSTFKLEAKWGFNRTTLKTFIGDRVKGTLVGLLILAPLMAFALGMFELGGDRAWLWIWLGYTAFQFFLLWIAPIAILPLFLKLSPLPEGDLKNAIEAYAKKQHFKLDGAYVCDASKRSTKTNAFFTGFGKFRRLVLFDTLIAKLESPTTTAEEKKKQIEEIVAIVAHEAGHFRLGHIWKSTLISTIVTGIALFLAQKIIESPDLFLTFGIFPPHPAYGLPLAVMLLGKLGFFASFIGSYFSRRNEYAADRFSVETYGKGEALIRGLRGLYQENLAILVQHPLYTALFASHPPFIPRTEAIRRLSS